MRYATFVALCLSLVGCGGPHLTKEQGRILTEQVAPELNRVLQVLHATNASIVTSKPFRAGDVVNARVSTNGILWNLRRDRFSFTLESRASKVRLLSMMVETPEVQAAMIKLWENPATLLERFRFANQIGKSLNETISNPTNEYRLAANQIQHVAQALGYQGTGTVVPGREVGVTLEWGRSPNGVPLSLGGGYVGLYNVSTNLESVDLVVLVHHGKVQAILQRPL